MEFYCAKLFYAIGIRKRKCVFSGFFSVYFGLSLKLCDLEVSSLKIIIDKKDFMEYIHAMVDKDFDNFMFANPYSTEEDYINLYYPLIQFII